MAGPLTLDIAANTRQAQAQVKDLGGALDNVADSLDDLAREADRKGDKTERALEGIERSADDVTDALGEAGRKMERTFGEMVQDAKKADKAVANVGDSGGKSFDKIKAGADEVRSEGFSNLSEAVSSFRGDIEDLGQVGQDTLGGLASAVAGTGPGGLVGALALAAGAAGLGLVTAGLEEAKRKQEENNQAAADWASAYMDSAGRIVSSASVVAGVQDIATDPERYKKATESARDWGVDVSTAMAAMAGDTTALAQATEGLARREQEWNAAMKESTATAMGGLEIHKKATEAEEGLADSVLRGRESLNQQTEAMRRGADQAQNAATALHTYATRVGHATGETDKLGNKILLLPDGKEIVVDAKTKTAYVDLETFERRKLSDKSIGVKVRVDTSDWDNWTPKRKQSSVVYGTQTNGRHWE